MASFARHVVEHRTQTRVLRRGVSGEGFLERFVAFLMKRELLRGEFWGFV
jgi:hypothetical protein